MTTNSDILLYVTIFINQCIIQFLLEKILAVDMVIKTKIHN